MEKIKIEQFGKDHWSLFAYIETRTVDHKGILNKDHLRIKNPVVANSTNYPMPKPEWNRNNGTRLKGFFEKKDKKLLIPDHDDFDCFDDLEEAGLIENMGTGFNPAAQLTKFGIKIASDLRKHKSEGKNFADFFLKEL